jgi:hypothetical protein
MTAVIAEIHDGGSAESTTQMLNSQLSHAARRLPVNAQIQAFYNVVRPDFSNNWQIRAQVQLMFPK